MTNMYIGRVWFLVVFLLFSLSFSALAVSPSSSELWENVRFVHLTDVIRNSTVVPGASSLVPGASSLVPGASSLVPGASSLVTLAHPQPLPQSFLFDLEDGVAPFYVAHWGHQKKFHIVDVNQLLPPQRITSHWHVYEGVHDAVDGKNWNDRKVAIVERAKYFKGQLYGGTNRDFMVIGPHRLSRESYIIAPRSLERTLRLGNPQYEGHWWFYEDSEHRNAAEAVEFLNTLFKNVNSKDWVITSERKPVTAAQKRALLVEFLDLGKSGYPVYDEILDLVSGFMLGGMLDKFVGDPACDLFFQSKYGNPDSLTLSFNGRMQFSKEFFASWIREDGIKWTLHDTDFRPMEKLIKGLFQQVEFTIINKEMAKYHWGMSGPSESALPREKLKQCQDLVSEFTAVEKKMSHLSPEAKGNFVSFRQKLAGFMTTVGCDSSLSF